MKEQNTIEIDVFQLVKSLWKRKLMILILAKHKIWKLF